MTKSPKLKSRRKPHRRASVPDLTHHNGRNQQRSDSFEASAEIEDISEFSQSNSVIKSEKQHGGWSSTPSNLSRSNRHNVNKFVSHYKRLGQIFQETRILRIKVELKSVKREQLLEKVAINEAVIEDRRQRAIAESAADTAALENGTKQLWDKIGPVEYDLGEVQGMLAELDCEAEELHKSIEHEAEQLSTRPQSPIFQSHMSQKLDSEAPLQIEGGPSKTKAAHSENSRRATSSGDFFSVQDSLMDTLQDIKYMSESEMEYMLNSGHVIGIGNVDAIEAKDRRSTGVYMKTKEVASWGISSQFGEALLPKTREQVIREMADTLADYHQTLTYEDDEETVDPLSNAFANPRIAQLEAEEWSSEKKERDFSYLLTNYFSSSSRTNRWLLFNFIYSGSEQRVYASLLPPEVDPRKLHITDGFVRGWDTDDAAMAILFENTLSSRASVIISLSNK